MSTSLFPRNYVRKIFYNLSISQTIPSLRSHHISPPGRHRRPSVRPAPPVSSAVGRHVQHELPEAVPRGAADQAAAAGLHYPHPAVDLRPVLQGPALRLPAHRHALLHLRHHRHAGQRADGGLARAGSACVRFSSRRVRWRCDDEGGYNRVVKSN